MLSVFPFAVNVLGIIVSSLSLEYINAATSNCFSLLMHAAPVALSLALLSAGSSMAARIAMMAMTTSNSIRVNPLRIPWAAEELIVREAFMFITSINLPFGQGSTRTAR